MPSPITAIRRRSGLVLCAALAGAATVAACSTDSNTSVVGPPAILTIAAGDGLNETVGLSIGPLVVKVTDTAGTPIPNITVTFVASTGLTLLTTTATTNVDGTALTSGTFNNVAGPRTVTATAAGIATPVIFHEVANTDVASSYVIVAGNNQTKVHGSALDDPMVVLVTDQYGNPIANIAVTWATPSGTLTIPSNHTGPDGRSQASLTLPATPGAIQVTATAGIGAATVTLTFTETGT